MNSSQNSFENGKNSFLANYIPKIRIKDQWLISPIFWTVIFTVAIFVIFASAVFVYLAVGAIRSEVSSLHLEIAQRARTKIADSVDNLLNEQKRASRDLALKREPAEEILSLLLKESKEFDQASLIDKSGKEILRINKFAIVTKEELLDLALSGGFKAASRGENYFSQVFFTKRGEPSISIFMPIISLRGEFLGALATEFNLKFMWDLVSEIKVGQRGRVYVVDGQGNLIADPNPSFVLRGENLLTRQIVRKLTEGEKLVNSLDPKDRYEDFEGRMVFASGLGFKPFGWGILTEEPLEDAFLASRRTSAVGITLPLASIALLLILAVIIRSLTRATNFLKAEQIHTVSIISNLTDGIIEYSADFKILLVNAEAERLLGIKDKELKGRFIGDIERSAVPENKSFLAVLADISKEGGLKFLFDKKEILTSEVNVSFPTEMTLEVTTVPIASPGGLVISNAKILRDITREKLLNMMKSEFLTIAAHQLRTPLSAIKWTLKTILDGDLGGLNAKQKDFLEKGYMTNERMISLVGDLLDASRIEEGRFGYEFKENDIVSFMEKLIRDLEPRFKQKELKLDFKKIPGKQILFFDREKMALALNNIFDNSINYTAQGGSIVVNFRLTPPYFEILIEDSGVGIPKNQQNRLYTKFFRGDNVIRMQTEGSGLGLFITKNIIVAHGGEIRIDSKEGKGTSVIFRLPVKKELVPEHEEPIQEFAEFLHGL